jgi:hypothetical protein
MGLEDVDKGSMHAVEHNSDYFPKQEIICTSSRQYLRYIQKYNVMI